MSAELNENGTGETLAEREQRLEAEQMRAEIKARLRVLVGGGGDDGGDGDDPFMFVVQLPLGGTADLDTERPADAPDYRDAEILYLRQENSKLREEANDNWRKHTAQLQLAHAKGLIEAAGDVYAILNRIVAAVGMLTEED